MQLVFIGLVWIFALPLYQSTEISEELPWLTYVDKTLGLSTEDAMVYGKDLFTFILHNVKHFSLTWNQCLERHYLVHKTALPDGDTLWQFPCLFARFEWGQTSLSYKISVQDSFQINLTFTEFFLAFGFQGCVYNNVHVSLIEVKIL